MIAVTGLVGLVVAAYGDRSLQAAATPPEAIIDNGTVQLGLNPEGHLIVSFGTMSRPDMAPSENGSTDQVGLRYMPTNGEALAPGCDCEGWGVSGDTGAETEFSGFTTGPNGTAGSSNLVVVSGSGGTGVTNTSGHTDTTHSVGSAFKSVVTTAGRLRVTHDIHPSSASPNLYEINVTVQNVSFSAVSDARYRRVMDFDVPPTTFHEHVEIHIPPTFDGILFRATTDGFRSADPLAPPGPFVGSPPTKLGYEAGDPTDYNGGPTDQGALFDLDLGPLAGLSEADPLQSGEAKAFTIYYGAAANRTEALKALSAVGATAYALGISSTSFDPAAPANNNDNVFIFGYGETGSGGTYKKKWDFGNHSFSLDSDSSQQFPDVAVTTKQSPDAESWAESFGTLLMPVQPAGPTPGMFTLYTLHNAPSGGFGTFLHTYIARDVNTIATAPCRPRLLHRYQTGPKASETVAFDETIEYYPIPPDGTNGTDSLDLFPLKLGPLVDDPGMGSQSDGFGGQWQPVDLGDPDCPDILGPACNRFDEWVTPNPDDSTVVNRNATMVVRFRYTSGLPPVDPRLSVAKITTDIQGFEPVTFDAPGESFQDNVFRCDSTKLECRINFKTTKLTPGTYTASVNSLSFCVQDVQFGVRGKK
jgi:hypothetical protein